MTIKKFALVALASASMIAATGAHASSVTSPAGLTFTVSSACTLTGNIVNLGTYTTADTIGSVVLRQGLYNNGATAGTDAPKAIASVTCPTGKPWLMSINGTGTNGSIAVNNPSGAVVFDTLGYGHDIDGVLNTVYLNGGNGITGTGNGLVQAVNGWFLVTQDTPYVATTPLVTGSYTAVGTAVLTF